LIAVRGTDRRSIGIKILLAPAGPAGGRGRPAIVTLDAENPPRACIRVEKEHSAVGRQPFETVVRFALRTHVGALHIGKAAGAFAPDPIEDFVQRTDFAGLHPLTGAIGLRLGG
jgi:hypothetical protein